MCTHSNDPNTSNKTASTLSCSLSVNYTFSSELCVCFSLSPWIMLDTMTILFTMEFINKAEIYHELAKNWFMKRVVANKHAHHLLVILRLIQKHFEAVGGLKYWVVIIIRSMNRNLIETTLRIMGNIYNSMRIFIFHPSTDQMSSKGNIKQRHLQDIFVMIINTGQTACCLNYGEKEKDYKNLWLVHVEIRLTFWKIKLQVK